MSSPESDLLTGISQLLEDEGVGVFDPAGGFASSDVAIVQTGFPTSPDRVISLDTYDVAHDGTFADSTFGLQVRTRGTKDPRVVKDIDSTVFNVIQGLEQVTVGGVRVVHLTRVSGAPLGTDGNGRAERTANYYVRIFRPAQHRD